MPILRRCCCMRDLRKGSFICAGWTIVWSLTGVVMTAVQMHEGRIAGMLNNKGLDGEVILWLTMVFASVVMMSSVVLIFAILKNIWRLMIPWMIFVIVLMVLEVSTLIINLVGFGFYSFTVIVMLLWVITTMINVYCELCVISHCQEIAAGRGATHDYVGNGNGYLVTYTTVISEVHTDQTPVGNGGAAGSVATVYAFNSTHMLESAAATDDAKEKMAAAAGSKERLASSSSSSKQRAAAAAAVAGDETKEKFSVGSTLSV